MANCKGCRFQFGKDQKDQKGCRCLTDIPERECSMHQTQAEYEDSLQKAYSRHMRVYGRILEGPVDPRKFGVFV